MTTCRYEPHCWPTGAVECVCPGVPRERRATGAQSDERGASGPECQRNANEAQEAAGRFLADDEAWGFIDPHGKRAEQIRREAQE